MRVDAAVIRFLGVGAWLIKAYKQEGILGPAHVFFWKIYLSDHCNMACSSLIMQSFLTFHIV